MSRFFGVIFVIGIFAGITLAYPKFDFTWKVVNIYDGDTIRVEHWNIVDKIRILGIDSPEIIWPYTQIKPYKFYWCWDQAKNFAINLLSGKVVKVYYDTQAKKTDKYWRKLRYLFLPYNKNWTIIYIPYGALAIYKWYAKVYKNENFALKKAYYRLQNIAKNKKIWIWSDYCKQQDQFIKQKYLNSDKQDYPSLDLFNNSNFVDNNLDFSKKDIINCGYTYHKPWCDIKGNIARNGEKIYHLPGWKYYNQTIINPYKGERWFCNEKKAKACWRRPSYAR